MRNVGNKPFWGWHQSSGGDRYKNQTYWVLRNPVGAVLAVWLITTPLAAQPPADSVRRNPRVSVESLLFTGYTRADTARGRWLTLGPLVPNLVQVNTAEGWVLGQTLDLNRRLRQNRQFLSVGGAARYGFSSRQPYAKAYVSWLIDRKKSAVIRVEGGRFIQQFNADEPITPLMNTGATLLRGVNFMKLYERRFLTIRYEQRIGNRFTLAPSLELARRVALPNRSFFSFRKKEARNFTANDPQRPEGNGLAFRSHDLILAGMDGQVEFGENFNRLTARYRQALPDDRAGAHFAKLSLHYEANRPAADGFGETRLSLSTGTFLWKNKLYFPDYWHFFGNETRALRTQLDAFALLAYYPSSTDAWFAQGFVERHFQGKFFGKIPLFRALGWHELTAVRALVTPERGLYAELTLGVENVFRLYRFDLIAGFGQPYGSKLAFRYGVAL